ncbi:hypothetical protein [Acinetobacter sp.]|uniref:hypothetical protein n=1 Tax=Acinetobacter sp. TaxID=472 RepID=UPI003D00D3C8
MRKQTVFVLILLVGVAFLVYDSYKLRGETGRQLAVQDSVLMVKDHLYTIQTSETAKLTLENDDLKQTLQAYGGREMTHLRIITEYKARLDSVHTTDTVYVTATDSAKARAFSVWAVPDELYLHGMFMVEEPYHMKFEQIRLRLAPEILLAQDDAGVWTAMIDTHSNLWTVEDIQLQVKEYRQPFMNLKPEVYAWYGFPQNELGIMSRIRIWKAYPYAGISASPDDTKLQIGVGMRLW